MLFQFLLLQLLWVPSLSLVDIVIKGLFFGSFVLSHLLHQIFCALVVVDVAAKTRKIT